MEYSEVSALLVRYGFDVALISLIVAALGFVLKRTMLKERQRIVMLITYATGVVIYAVYKCIAERDALFAFVNFVEVFERGLAIGTFATLITTALIKFTSGGNSDSLGVIEALIDGIVPGEKLKECAKAILAAIDEDAESLAAILAGILTSYAEDADEADIECAAEEICAAFKYSDEEQSTTE